MFLLIIFQIILPCKPLREQKNSNQVISDDTGPKASDKLFNKVSQDEFYL